MASLFKSMVSDVAETIRRAFKDPDCHGTPLKLPVPGQAAIGLLDANCHELAYRFEPDLGVQDLVFKTGIQNVSTRFDIALRAENAWAAWASGAKVCDVNLFKEGNCGRWTVPSLPRSAVTKKTEIVRFQTVVRAYREALPVPPVRGIMSRLASPKTRGGINLVIGLPIAIAGQDFQKLPKALNMRYTFQLVKNTGENIRNLEVLGVYPVPVKGVAELRHEPRTGRILVNLTHEAIGARRGRFILARKKDDRSYVSCFVED